MNPGLKEAANVAMDQIAYSRLSVVAGRVAIWFASMTLVPFGVWLYSMDTSNIKQDERIANLIHIVDGVVLNQVNGREIREKILSTQERLGATQEQEWDATKRVLDSLQSQLNRLDDKIDRINDKYGSVKH